MGVLGLWVGVLRVILGLSRGVAGVFCREIPGFLGGVRARRGDSAHGGRCRGGWTKKFFKKGGEKGEKPKNWGARGAGRWCGASYIGCAR